MRHAGAFKWSFRAGSILVAGLLVLSFTASEAAVNLSSGEVGEHERQSGGSNVVPAITASGGLAGFEQGPDGGEFLTDEARNQSPLIEARSVLEEAALATGRDGLAAINPNFDEGRIDVYWKGEIPGALREAVKQVREGFDVRVHDAPHSWLEMDEEAHRILALVNGNEELEFIATVAMKHDLSGLRLLVSDPEYQSSRTDGGIQAELQSDMPITVEYAEWVAGLTPAGS